MRQRVLAAIARVDALRVRDRYTLLGGMLAVAIGAQALWLAPARDKRMAIAESAILQESGQGEADLIAAAQKSTALEALRNRNRELEGKLAGLGLKAAQREAAGSFVTRSLRGDSVRLTALTALPVEELANVELPGAPDTTPPTDASTAATSAAAHPTLFRHRTELRLEGPVQGVLQAIEKLERELAPLRVERIRVTPVGSAGAVQASLVLTTISEERTWLAL